MFKHNYQGGAVVEVFSGQGKDPVARWKLFGGQSSIQKEYDKEVKGFVYCLDGSCKSVKMQMPGNGKMTLGLLQRFLAIQVKIPPDKDFSMELVVTDVGHLKRRLYLSTVHKDLSATLWHAKIPLSGVKRNIWTTLFVDLGSFTRELFKAAGFLSLDGITLFASCSVRRIFTVKAEPSGLSSEDMFLGGAEYLMAQIPRSCQLPPNMQHECQVLNMTVLQKATSKTTLSDGGLDQQSAARSATSQRTKPQAASHVAPGCRATAAATHSGRKGGSATNGLEKGEPCGRKTGFNLMHQQSTTDVGDSDVGTSSSMQSHPSRSKVGNKQTPEKRKLRFLSVGPERLETPLGPGHVDPSRRNETREKCSPPSSRLESRHKPLTQEGTREVVDEDMPCLNSPKSSTISPPPTPAESPLSPTRLASSPDPQVRSYWESNDGEPELRLALQEEVFTFSTPPNSPKRGQGQSEQKMETGGDGVQSPSERRCEAQPQDDFIGSDEEKSSISLFHPTSMTGSIPEITEPLPFTNLDSQPESQNSDQASAEELCSAVTDMHLDSRSCVSAEDEWNDSKQCHSPRVIRQDQRCGSGGPKGVNQAVDRNNTLSLSCLQEVSLEDPFKEEDETIQPGDCGDWHLKPTSRLQLHEGDDDELQMLASLKRQQEEDESRASGLSASLIQQCNVSMSLSSEDNSTWTHVSLPANQGHHYQKEMNPVQCSNPREWMDVLSPPIMPPCLQRRSNEAGRRHQDLIKGREESENEEEMEDEYLNLLYDPSLNCYFDPETGKYYELA
ncbi:protein CFAP20DC isoform X3 [Nerophis lumbriciformis]|uniref:protein CFAP20DC isoform X3 n=1 Tax=Nerophis lumbriciformis TaxID=546530 RepID=UPI002ADFBDC1|nr:protein CFAP20DC-like isoform X3 [Nerophis lumbriciformis]